jgi:hypothetical protein
MGLSEHFLLTLSRRKNFESEENLGNGYRSNEEVPALGLLGQLCHYGR